MTDRKPSAEAAEALWLSLSNILVLGDKKDFLSKCEHALDDFAAAQRKAIFEEPALRAFAAAQRKAGYDLAIEKLRTRYVGTSPWKRDQWVVTAMTLAAEWLRSQPWPPEMK